VTEQLSANFKPKVDELNTSIEEGIEMEVSKLNFMITSLNTLRTGEAHLRF